MQIISIHLDCIRRIIPLVFKIFQKRIDPRHLEGEAILAPLEGKFYRVKSAQETAKNVGDSVQRGDIIGYIEAMKTYNAIRAEFDGTITEFIVKSGDSVEEDDVLMKIARK